MKEENEKFRLLIELASVMWQEAENSKKKDKEKLLNKLKLLLKKEASCVKKKECREEIFNNLNRIISEQRRNAKNEIERRKRTVELEKLLYEEYCTVKECRIKKKIFEELQWLLWDEIEKTSDKNYKNKILNKIKKVIMTADWRPNKKKCGQTIEENHLMKELLRASRIQIELSNDVFEQIEITYDTTIFVEKAVSRLVKNKNTSFEEIMYELNYILFSKIDYFIYCLSSKQEEAILFKNEKQTPKIKKYEKKVRDIEKKVVLILKRLFHPSSSKIRKGFGTHDAEIVSVRLLNEKYKETKTFVTGKPFIAEIRYVAHKKLQRPMFGIAIHHENGVHICGPNTTFSGKTLEEVKGKGKVIFRIDSLPLLEGKYLFSATVMNYETSTFYDFHWKEFKFSVFNGGLSDKYGLFYIPHHWEYK